MDPIINTVEFAYIKDKPIEFHVEDSAGFTPEIFLLLVDGKPLSIIKSPGCRLWRALDKYGLEEYQENTELVLLNRAETYKRKIRFVYSAEL